MQGPCLSSLCCSKGRIRAARGDSFNTTISIFSIPGIISSFLCRVGVIHPGSGPCPSPLGYQCSVLPTLLSSLVLALFCTAMQLWFMQVKGISAGITFEGNCHFHKLFLGAFIDPVIVNKNMCRERVEDFFYNNFFQEPLIWLKINRTLLIYTF